MHTQLLNVQIPACPSQDSQEDTLPPHPYMVTELTRERREYQSN